MATKSLFEKAKDAITSVFEDKPARKSPQRVAAGKKAATTRQAGEALAATKKAATKAVKAAKKAVKAPAKKSARKR